MIYRRKYHPDTAKPDHRHEIRYSGTMSSRPIIVWFRADLRVHDHPALAAACRDAEQIIPLFVFDERILKGKFASSNRNRFLLECLKDLKHSLVEKGGNLVVRSGSPETILVELAKESDAKAVYYSGDFTPYALSRDKQIEDALKSHDIEARSFGGKLAVTGVMNIKTTGGDPYRVFTPFWKSWANVRRRDVAQPPHSISLPQLTVGSLPALDDLTTKAELSDAAAAGGETEARNALSAFLDENIDDYGSTHNDMGADQTSRLSPYLHFGCLSPREIETQLPDSAGARAWHRQLAWREFYYYVLYHYPHPGREFQERYRDMSWVQDEKSLQAWKDGQTGYPAVDAAMRQLRREGWMHNRGRLIVGSFLTKDLGIDWREGEAHFMQWLLDGDMANNNGNWQWIASVGVDPAPVFRRLYNPSSQRDKYDPDGTYVRTYVPELKDVPDNYLSEPWQMSDDEQAEYNCTIGKDYPEPIIDHKAARQEALERYRSQ